MQQLKRKQKLKIQRSKQRTLLRMEKFLMKKQRRLEMR
jgi:hypothetical protein